MNRRTNLALRASAVSAAVLVAGAMAAGPAAAATGDVQVVNTETVQVYTSSTGKVETKRIYEQLALTGTGHVDLLNPVALEGLRNLDGFGSPQVTGGDQVVKLDVDGKQRLRSVSDYKGKLPLDVKVEYLLDGKSIDPSDVVGQSGALEVKYTVKNVTGQPQEVTIADGNGGTVKKTVEVPIPIVGSVTTSAPESFTEVESASANMAGDGKGGTKLSFTLTLFPPIGTDTAEFGYTANISDGVVPRTSITALPVNPLEVPTFKNAANSYAGGADTGAELAAGAGEIDANLLKLRDGAADLLGGLIKLRDGADELRAGLSGKAAPGAKKLAAGAGELADGTGTASDGAGKLRDGGRKLAGGLGDLNDGAVDLNNGAGRLAAGQASLVQGLQALESGVQQLPSSVTDKLSTDPQYQALLEGMQSVVDGIGSPSDVTNPATGRPATFFGGLNAIRGGLVGQVKPGLEGAMAELPGSRERLNCAAAVLSDLAGGAKAPGVCFPPGNVRPPLSPEVSPVNIAVLSSMAGQLKDGAAGLEELHAGLGQILGAIDHQFVPGIDKLKAGLNNPGADANCAIGASTPTPLDDCGIQQAVAFFKLSVPALVDGITASISQNLLANVSVPADGCQPDTQTLLCGAGALAQGGVQLADGTSKLASGAGQLDAGGALLAAKLGELADGLSRIDGGANKLAAGSDELAGGLGDAADGSGQLANGLKKAAGGAPQLVDGAGRLSDEGTKKLVEAGKSTAVSYGEMYAVIEAGAKRADAEKMVVGAPDDAIGLAAYSYEIQGEDGEGDRNLARGLGGLALLAVAGGTIFLRRRVLA